jgi:hypothetical protein
VRQLSNLGAVNLAAPESNLYKIIGESTLVLAVPFTSPATIAKEMGVESAFICFDLRDFELPSQYAGIPIITTKELLSRYLNSISWDA